MSVFGLCAMLNYMFGLGTMQAAIVNIQFP